MRSVMLEGPRGMRLRAMVPETRGERMRGLVGRASLDPSEALLLERTRSVHTFGMRFPLRVALLDAGHVVRAVVRLPPRRLLLPRRGIRHVLELRLDADVRPGDPLTRSRSRWRRGAHAESLYFHAAAPGPGAGAAGRARAPIV